MIPLGLEFGLPSVVWAVNSENGLVFGEFGGEWFAIVGASEEETRQGMLAAARDHEEAPVLYAFAEQDGRGFFDALRAEPQAIERGIAGVVLIGADGKAIAKEYFDEAAPQYPGEERA